MIAITNGVAYNQELKIVKIQSKPRRLNQAMETKQSALLRTYKPNKTTHAALKNPTALLEFPRYRDEED